MISSRSSSFSLILAGTCLVLAGCALRVPTPELANAAELTEVPFFPQSEFDCGPAALATILNAAGITVTVDELIDAVYIEGLRGSLQVELLAATRRKGLLPMPVGENPDDLLREVVSGRPVLVLQNLRLARFPAWHYAVVVGYSAEDERFILRSGEEQRRRERTARFLRSWELADHWGFVALRPGEVSASATPDVYMRALLGAEDQLGRESADLAYGAALEHWPGDTIVLFLAGTREHALGDAVQAERLYRRVLALEPDHAAARNNLANILLERGCVEQAASEARTALAAQGPDGEFVDDIAATLREIEAADPTTVCKTV